MENQATNNSNNGSNFDYQQSPAWKLLVSTFNQPDFDRNELEHIAILFEQKYKHKRGRNAKRNKPYATLFFQNHYDDLQDFCKHIYYEKKNGEKGGPAFEESKNLQSNP